MNVDPVCLVGDEPVFYVQFVRGKESLKVFDYNPLTRAFTATSFAAGRASITQGVSLTTVFIGSDLAMAVDSAGLVNVEKLSEKTKVESPRVEFYRRVGGISKLLAMLSANWLVVKRLIELPTIPVTTDQFQFYSKACIGLQGLICDGVSEV